MDKALDNYALGKQIEVSAEKMDLNYSISARTGRFKCAECGEPVFFTPKTIRKDGSIIKAHFGHLNKNDLSVECEQRIQSSYAQNLYQRVGQNLYIRKTSRETFGLMIGFEPIGVNMLDEYGDQGATIRIYNEKKENQEIRIPINRQLFYSDKTTYLDLSFVSTGKYSIEYSKGVDEKKWACFAEGFSPHGAVFTYTENGGKAVHRQGSITTHVPYYIVGDNTLFSRLPSELTHSYVGTLKLADQTWRVERVEYKNYSDSDANGFKNVQLFFDSYFHLSLLLCEPKVIPLWPPCKNTETNKYQVNGAGKAVYCFIQSANEIPEVHEYVEQECNSLSIGTEKVLEIDVLKRNVVLSVDRRYFGNNYHFSTGNNTSDMFNVRVNLTDVNGAIDYYGYHDDPPLKGEVMITGNVPLIINHVRNGDSTTARLEDEGQITVTDVRNGSRIIIDSYYHIGEYWILPKKKDTADNRLETIYDELRRDNSFLVQTPRWIYKALNRENSPAINSLIMQYIRSGRISIRALSLLRNECEKEVENES